MEFVISFPGGAQVDATIGGMTISTNQDGSAPSPFALFLASMGTCAGIYVLSFLQQRGLPTEDVKIREQVIMDPFTHMVKEVALHVDLPESFPSKYEKAIIRAASQCAVKKHLEIPPNFTIETHIG